MPFTSCWETEWQRLKDAILSNPSVCVLDVQLYGSRVSGFGENADVDATVFVPGHDAVPVLQMLEGALPRLLPDFEVLERVYWVANKRFEISKFKFKISRARTSELQGSFSAVSKPNFASKYSLESSRRDLHNALLCTVL